MKESLTTQAQAAEGTESPADLQTQLEALLHQVWLCEAEWRLDNRIELALRQDQ